MRNVVLKAAAVLAASVVAVFIVGCDDVTGPATEFGNAVLIYELVSDDMYNIRLADASLDGDGYILRTYNAETKERGLWYLEPADGEPILIGEDTMSWWGSPKLSPDKENVVYQEGSGIYVVLVASGEPRLIYWHGLDPTATQWIDNETVLIYVGEEYWEIKTVNVNTLETNTLLSVDTSTVDYVYLSPDGKYLFVKGGIQEGDEFNPLRNFFRIYDTETWEYDEYRPENYYPSGPWSPDGTKIAIGVTNSQRTHLGYFDVATSEQIMVFSSYKLLFNYPAYLVIWSPDGKMLGSEDRDDNILRVFAVDVE